MVWRPDKHADKIGLGQLVLGNLIQPFVRVMLTVQFPKQGGLWRQLVAVEIHRLAVELKPPLHHENHRVNKFAMRCERNVLGFHRQLHPVFLDGSSNLRHESVRKLAGPVCDLTIRSVKPPHENFKRQMAGHSEQLGSQSWHWLKLLFSIKVKKIRHLLPRKHALHRLQRHNIESANLTDFFQNGQIILYDLLSYIIRKLLFIRQAHRLAIRFRSHKQIIKLLDFRMYGERHGRVILVLVFIRIESVSERDGGLQASGS
mmetsp:Transcript_16973/g.29702  ORF Transcript_16973/g.29702 Transcript_16973/m.29702 type:complete len:259 (+) Transcript_16973:93-869(+)